MRVVILSDNKPGHYKQSLGIVERLPNCEMEWVTVEFRHKWRDNLLRVFMCVLGGTSLSLSFIHTLLRWSLTADTYSALTTLHIADITLSNRFICRSG